MPTDIKLQPNIFNNLPVVILLGILLCSPLLYWLFQLLLNAIKRRKEKRLANQVVAPKPLRPLPRAVKEEYLRKLDILHNKFNAKEISSKVAYHNISMLVREFAKSYADLDLTTKTLSEIDNNRFPQLYGLIGELYEPEFSKEKEKNIEAIILQAKRIIETWN